MGKSRWMAALGLALVSANGDTYLSKPAAEGSRTVMVQDAPPKPGPPGFRATPEPLRFGVIVDKASRAHGVEVALVHALIFAESSYDPRAVSPAGAMGLMQLMPETARRYGVRDLFDPEQNVGGGVRHLKDLIEQFEGDIELAVAAYNAGPGAVTRAGNRVPPYPETARYVPRVLGHYHRLRGTRSN